MAYYYGGMDDREDADFAASDSESSESSAVIPSMAYYYGGMDDRDFDFDFAASDPESSESSAAISVASSDGEQRREEEGAAADVRSPSFPT